MFAEMLGTFMVLVFRVNGVGGCRWLMCDEILGLLGRHPPHSLAATSWNRGRPVGLQQQQQGCLALRGRRPKRRVEFADGWL